MNRLVALVCAIIVGTTVLTAPTSASAVSVHKSVKGSGDRVVRVNLNDVSLVQVRHSGDSNFAVWAVNRAGRRTELLVNTIGDYAGTTVVTATKKRRVRALVITADGSWSLKTKPLRKARAWSRAVAEGRGDSVLRVPVRKLALRAVYRGGGNFAIWAYNKSGRRIGLLVNEIGRYRGTTLMPAGTKYVSVTAESGRKWRLTKR
jgi:hypothetical protein